MCCAWIVVRLRMHRSMCETVPRARATACVRSCMVSCRITSSFTTGCFGRCAGAAAARRSALQAVSGRWAATCKPTTISTPLGSNAVMLALTLESS